MSRRREWTILIDKKTGQPVLPRMLASPVDIDVINVREVLPGDADLEAEIEQLNARLSIEMDRLKVSEACNNVLEAEIEQWKIENKELWHDLQEAGELRSEIDRLKRVIAKELSENDELGCEYTYVNALRDANIKLREALEFYADRDSYSCEDGSIWDDGDLDFGKRAHEALADDTESTVKRNKSDADVTVCPTCGRKEEDFGTSYARRTFAASDGGGKDV